MSRFLVLFWPALALGCSSSDLETPATTDGETPQGGASQAGASGAGRPPVLPASSRLVSLYEPRGARSATALAFNPKVPGELWVTLRKPAVDAPCTEDVPTGCSALIGEMAIITGATGPGFSSRVEQDGNGWHFLRRPTSIAFGDNGNLATCAEARTGNYDDDEYDFSGPVLWSSDPAIFGAKPEPGQNGTHLDMLHSTPFCMGIGHERENVYWAFNGQRGALDRYDFNEPHVIGGEDHTDGELERYVEGSVARTPEIPSHVVVDQQRGRVYAADTGNGRVVAVTLGSGTAGAPVPEYDGMPRHVAIDGAELSVLVAKGVLQAPSGVALHGGVLFVTDNATGTVWAFDSEGAELGRLVTGLAPGSLGGIAIGPDAKAYVADLATGKAYRIEAE